MTATHMLKEERNHQELRITRQAHFKEMNNDARGFFSFVITPHLVSDFQHHQQTINKTPENNAGSDIFTDGEPEHALEVIVYKFKYFNTLDFLFIEQFFFPCVVLATLRAINEVLHLQPRCEKL